MARVKGAMMTRKHRKKILGLAKGYWGILTLPFCTLQQGLFFIFHKLTDITNIAIQICSNLE